jgi:hypothetical protein
MAAIHYLLKHFMAVIAWTFVMIWPPGIDNGAFLVSPDTVWYALVYFCSVWYARVLLLFSASAATDAGSKAFNCVLVLTLESYDDPENDNHNNYDYYIH